MKNIAIYGAGGSGREVLCLINSINNVENTYNFIGFFDDGIKKGIKTKYGEILGNIDDLNKIQNPLSIVISIGSPDIIFKISNSIYSNKIEFVNLIHPSTEILDSVTICKGNIFSSGTIISCDVSIGNFNFFSSKCVVGHDTKIGSYNVFGPNTQISGNVSIGNNNSFGLNSSIIQGKSVGNANRIGGHSFVIRNIKDNSFYFGVPATRQNY